MHFFGLMAVSRTSMANSSIEIPCDEAERVPFVRVDRRNIDDPLKNKFIGKTWYDFGRNHRVENGCIARDFDDERWMVWIADSDAFKEFIEKYGRVIISLNSEGLEPCYEIEIYDYYRE